MKFNHEIRMVCVYSSGLDADGETIAKKQFRQSFSKSAYKWFDAYVKDRLPYARKVKDTSITRYHFEFGDCIFELR